ncbi:MAG TPA: response regulator [Methanomassiliicoccales archaeon]|nr:response regulator [Methanomassiliicoccales archaeon]
MTANENGKIKVLVLDDEEDFLELCREFFGREERIDAAFVSSPAMALDILASDDYQVVVSDHNLPGMDGLQFLRATRSLRKIPFILITGHGREGLAIDALSNGADFYLEKAGSPRGMFEQLLRAIKAVGSPAHSLSECLPDPFQVFSAGGTLLISNGGERVLAAASR